MPSEDELKSSVFSMDPDNSSRPDGLLQKYPILLGIIANDIVQASISIFVVLIFPSGSLILPSPKQFNDIRPISLCNVINKLFAKLLNSKLSHLYLLFFFLVTNLVIVYLN